MPPVVSVIIPSYNRHNKLIRAINSVRKQEAVDSLEIEIIVVNDCSKEESYYARYVRYGSVASRFPLRAKCSDTSDP